MRSDAELEQVMQTFADTVWRVASLYLPSHDAEDVFQNTFIRYATETCEFNDDEHRKAWLIRVATNLCKDHLKSAVAKTHAIDDFSAHGLEQAEAPWKENAGPPGTHDDPAAIAEGNPVREAMAQLPEEYREVLFLRYFEGYEGAEIADLLGKPVNTIYTHLSRGKQMLKEVLEHERS